MYGNRFTNLISFVYDCSDRPLWYAAKNDFVTVIDVMVTSQGISNDVINSADEDG